MKRIMIVIFRYFFSLFYDSKYLKGRWFDNSYCGWIWCFKCLVSQKIMRNNPSCRFPVSGKIKVTNGNNIIFDSNNLDNFHGFGNYYQCSEAKIYIGKGTYIAPNTGLITANHDINNLDKHIEGKDIVIGKDCWIGMNSVVLPGVILGDNTIVGAGSVVTKSFEEGNCVIAGNPAKIIRTIER